MSTDRQKTPALALLDAVGSAERWIALIAFLLLIVVIFADVASRELTGSGLHWARQIGVYANIFVVMMGFGLASSRGVHLRPRIADGWLPAAWESRLIRLGDVLTALFCLAFAIVAAQVVAETFLMQERSVVLRILIWPVQAVVPLVFFVAATRYSIYAAVPSLRPAEQQFGTG